jgi:class 3 adenylate cyclase
VFLSSWISQIEHLWALPAAARFLKRLSRFSRLILLDKRGSGLSDRVTGTPGVDERMDDVRAAMDAVGSERAAILGTSEGGPLGAVFAATHPDRTLALIMAGSGARFSQTDDYPWGWAESGMELVETYIRTDWGSGGSAGMLDPDHAEDQSFRAWMGQLERLTGSPGTMLELWRWTMEIDIRSVLPVIRVPTLILHRVGDVLVPVEHGRYLAEHIIGAKYVELPGSEHYAFLGNVDLIADEVEEFLTGVRHGPESDRILATVLFSDIVNSTTQASTMGDRAWHERLDAHDAMVRRQLERFRGREIKTMGDGFLAAFDGPGRAIQCGCAIRDGAQQLGVEVRLGLHTGEIELRGDDISGMTVNIGARVAARARAGEVLVSRTVTDLLAGSGIAFEDHGEHDLKGVPGTWRLFAVRP